MASAYIKLSSDSIMASAFASTYDVEIEANCDWTIEYEGDDSWWTFSGEDSSIGNGEISLALESNDSDAPRTVIFTIANGFGTVVKKLVITQSTFTPDGYEPISDLRALASNGSYTFTEAAKMKGVTVSNPRYGNFYDNCIAVESSAEPNSGIVIRANNTLYLNQGEEVEVNLLGATVSRNSATGLVEVAVDDDSKITRTSTTKINPVAVTVSADELLSGAYEGMFVTVDGQVLPAELRKESLAGTLQMQDNEGTVYNMTVLESCSFSTNSIPTGSGSVAGIAVKMNGIYGVMPTTVDDLLLSGARTDDSVVFPYIFSFMSLGADRSPKYLTFFQATDPNDCYGTNDDGTGATIRFYLNSASKYINMWTENSGHHNIPSGTWAGAKGEHYIQLEYPMGEDVEGDVRLSFGLSSQANAPKNWVVQYSTDYTTWYDAENAPNVVLPDGKTYGSGKNYFYHEVDFHPVIPINRKQTLYVRITPYNNVSVSGGTVTSSSGRVSLHSCVVIDYVPSYSTKVPANAIYFEPFDMCTHGLDYRNGDKLSGMMNFCGADISTWSVTNGLSGENVHQRPGYAQIGYVETQYDVAQTDYTNTVGVLNTPKLNASGTLKLSFKAMAYKNKSVYNVGTKASLDINGDMTVGTLEVVGGGTINGDTKVKVPSMSYDSFKLYSYTIEGATSDTYLRFTSEPTNGAFSRWFVDEICVTK